MRPVFPPTIAIPFRCSFSAKLLLALGVVSCGLGQSPKPGAEVFAEIRQALAEKLPQIAVTKTRQLLEKEKLTPELTSQAKLLLAEALLRADDPVGAAEVLKNESGPEAVFWRTAALQKAGKLTAALKGWATWAPPTGSPLIFTARINHICCLAALAKHAEALTLLHKVREETRNLTAPRDQALAAQLNLWEAELLLTLGKPAEAIQTLGPPPPGPDKATWAYLEGKTKLAQNDPASAILSFRMALTEAAPAREPMITLGLAKALRMNGQYVEAGRSLATLISTKSDSSVIDEAFEELLRCAEQPDSAKEITEQLAIWAAGPVVELAAKATFAQLQAPSNKKASARLEEIAAFVAKFPKNPLIPRVQLQRIGLLISDDRFPEAKSSLASLDTTLLPPAIQHLHREMEAYLAYAQEDFSGAAESFANLAKTAEGPEEKLRSAYNSALASMKNGSSSSGPGPLVTFTAGMPENLTLQWQASLTLEQGLQAAADDEREDALTLLRDFLAKNAGHPREFEALMVMAELQPDQPRWLKELKAKATTPPTQNEVWLLELELQSTGPLETYLKNVNAYLAANPEAPEAAQIHFRSGEACFNQQQLVEAEIRFTKAATAAAPESVMAAAAHYWAGKAALGSMAKGVDDKALKHWEAASQGNSPFRHRAKIAQAQLCQRRNQPDAALQILADILTDKTPPPEAETRYAVLCLRSELLGSLPNASKEKLTEALKHCESVINAPGASVSWKQEASFRRAAILELQKQPKEALEGYYATMSPPITPQPILETADFHWFLRAGEKALAILESQKDWKGAVAIAQKMAQAPGPLGDAARIKAERLKTQHLIWDDESP